LHSSHLLSFPFSSRSAARNSANFILISLQPFNHTLKNK
jgi:hypothetical protein